MLFAIALLHSDNGGLRAVAPQLDGCEVSGASEQECLPRLRLAIEGRLTELLLAGAGLPAACPAVPSQAWPQLDGARWASIHINLVHLEALARHQAGR